MDATLFVSVIIPTYHDWDRLKLSLNALAQQSYPADRFEVIVVNNDPEDQPPYVVANGNVRLLAEAKPGSYAARNAAIRVAKGEIFAFTDSDCIPDNGWLSKGIADLLKTDADVISGAIDVFKEPNTTWAAWKYESIVAFRQHSREYPGAVTANLISWRGAFEDVGLFNERAYSGGDSEWTKAAREIGKVVAKSGALVNHPARNSINSIMKRNRRVLGGRLLRADSKTEVLKIMLNLLIPPFRAIRIWRLSGASWFDCTIAFTLRSAIKCACLPEAVNHIRSTKLKND